MAPTLVGEKRWHYLSKAKTIRIASTEEDGSIYLSPVWLVVRDKRIFIPIDAAGRHAVNVLARRPLAGLVDAGDEYSTVSGVRIVGHMRPIDDDDTALFDELQQMMFDKYFGVGHPHAYAYFEMGEMAGRRYFELVPEKMVGWDMRESALPLSFEARTLPPHVVDRHVGDTQ